MTIHWKALEEHFLMVPLLSDGTIIFWWYHCFMMVPLVFRINHFWGINTFSEFSPKPPSLKSY
jgi:hypothetical protein